MRRIVIYPGRTDFEKEFGKMLLLSALDEKLEAEIHDSDAGLFNSIYSDDVFAVVSVERDNETKEKLISQSSDFPYESVILYGFDDVMCRTRYLKRPFRVDDLLACAIEFCNGDSRMADKADCGNAGDNIDDKQKSIFEPFLDEGIAYDGKNNVFLYNKESLSLTQREAELLMCLYEKRGTAVSREEAAFRVWGSKKNTNVVDVYIRYLRQKLDERFDKKIIYTVRNGGYMLK